MKNKCLNEGVNIVLGERKHIYMFHNIDDTRFSFHKHNHNSLLAKCIAVG